MIYLADPRHRSSQQYRRTPSRGPGNTPLASLVWALVASSALLAAPAAAFDYQYTGCYSALSGYSSQGTNIYQASLACSTACSGYSYFALSDGNECLCGNSAPSGAAGSCDTTCVGYPGEPCGGSSSFTVYKLVSDNSGSGAVTFGSVPANSDSSDSSLVASSSSTPSASPSTTPATSSSSTSSLESSTGTSAFSSTLIASSSLSSPSTSLILATSTSVAFTPSSSVWNTPTSSSTNTLEASTSVISSSASSSTPKTSSLATSTTSTTAPTTSPTTSTTSLSPIISIKPTTVTSVVNGQSTIIITVVPSSTETQQTSSTAAAAATSSAAAAAATSKSSSNGISGGAIAGIVVGVICGVVIVLAALFFMRRRAKRMDGDGLSRGASTRLRADPYATPSLKSSQSFIGAGANGNGGRHGRYPAVGGGGGGASPASDPFTTQIMDDKLAFAPGPAAAAAVDDFMAVDQRLNPVMLGDRRFSEGSLADDRDYSRKILRVANP